MALDTSSPDTSAPALLHRALDLDLRGLADTEVADEAGRILTGEAYATTDLAGLQFYDYGSLGLEGEPVIPRPGDRLQLIREPANAHDPNAVEVWWRNGVRLGHLPRGVAQRVAPHLDAGVPLRAYVSHGGTGAAWSMRALLVGEPVRPIHEKRIARAERDGVDSHRDAERAVVARRRRVGADSAYRFAQEQADRRQKRLAQAANALLMSTTFEIEPPEVGTTVELYAIQKLLGVSRSTARRLVERAGGRVEVTRRGGYATGSHVTVTAALRDVLRAWAARPRSRVRAANIKLSSGSVVERRPARDPDDIPF